jgi:hypothetical protein
MKVKFALALFGIGLISGCQLNGHLFPVQGPLASLAPPPVYSVKMTGAINSGNLVVALADGEKFSGPWKQLSVNARTQSAGDASSFNLASAWDTVYGQSFYSAHVLGTRLFTRTLLTGSQGTVLQVEMYKQEDHREDATTSGIRGVAKDSKGNIYKLVF